jgi:hypothetical protein
MAMTNRSESAFDRRFGGADEVEGSEVEAAMRDHTLWTMIEGDNGRTYLVPGRHYVNRISYYRSHRPWTDADVASGLTVRWG